LKIEESNYTGTPARNNRICVYDAGVLVGGIEPDGTTPQSPTPSPTPTPPQEPEFTYGDLNGDGRVNSSDLALMKRYVVKQIEKLNVPVKAADLNGDDKVNSTDYSVLKEIFAPFNRGYSDKIKLNTKMKDEGCPFLGGLLFIILCLKYISNTNRHILHILLVGYANYFKNQFKWRDFA